MDIIDDFLPYNDLLEYRDPHTIDMVVLHCTEVPTLQQAREFGERILYEDSKTGNSGHFYIDRDGRIYRYVKEDRIARHVIGHNQRSIGIEIVNSGRYPKWYSSKHQVLTEKYTQAQIQSVKELLRFLKQQFPKIGTIARHSDLDTQWIPAQDDPKVTIRRKVDPGPLFPWDEIQDWWTRLAQKS